MTSRRTAAALLGLALLLTSCSGQDETRSGDVAQRTSATTRSSEPASPSPSPSSPSPSAVTSAPPRPARASEGAGWGPTAEELRRAGLSPSGVVTWSQYEIVTSPLVCVSPVGVGQVSTGWVIGFSEPAAVCTVALASTGSLSQLGKASSRMVRRSRGGMRLRHPRGTRPPPPRTATSRASSTRSSTSALTWARWSRERTCWRFMV